MSNLELIPCPLCGNHSDFESLNINYKDEHISNYGSLYAGSQKSEWKICSQCGFVHQNSRPSKEDLNLFYLTSSYHRGIPESYLLENGKHYIEFARWYYLEKIQYAIANSNLKTPGKIFDIGAGFGGVLKIFAQDLGWQVYGVEPDTYLYGYAANHLGLSSIQNTILDSNTEIGDQVDLVFSNHAFEHFADLGQVMLGIQKILKPGGYIFTAIPTYYKNRSDLSLQWMNSAHYSMFTDQSINQLFSQYGFEEVTHTYRGWNKEIDDLWHLARFTGIKTDPQVFYEDSSKVKKYINTINPINSIINYPIYSNYAEKIKAINIFKRRLRFIKNNIKLLFISPKSALSNIKEKLFNLFNKK
ncbi:MAG: class I SAM-dependent methyltransferase [Pseudanabaena sp. Salubria-1]|nr:class I SAM-dependent methyltransferase [Pseudanabaena sp. Salubria-1]